MDRRIRLFMRFMRAGCAKKAHLVQTWVQTSRKHSRCSPLLRSSSASGSGTQHSLLRNFESTRTGTPCETLVAWAQRASISGWRGDDLLVGRGGDDHLLALGDHRRGSGTDRLFGGSGDDLLSADKGPDRLGGGPDSHWLRAGRGPDRLSGGPGGDDLVGERGEDLMRGRAGDDLFTARGRFADVWRETAGSIQPISMLGLT
jgi:Ca2+-binding RTX toxin-like protein